MTFKMTYSSDHRNVAPFHVEMNVCEDANLRQMFLSFVEMTKIMGYNEKSWTKILKEGYQYCVLHEDALPDYNIFQWADDCIEEEW